MQEKEEKKEPEVVEEILHEYYTDVMRVIHHARTFVIDFGRIVPFRNQIKYETRVVMSPQHYKALVNTLKGNLEKYEEVFGYITLKG